MTDTKEKIREIIKTLTAADEKPTPEDEERRWIRNKITLIYGNQIAKVSSVSVRFKGDKEGRVFDTTDTNVLYINPRQIMYLDYKE